jgi:serine/threonine protein kinase
MLAPGTWIDDRYEVHELLGRGGMADVLRAEDTVTGEAVAVKVLRDHDLSGLARFHAELSALRALDHPSVVRLRDAGVHDEDQPYLVLDLVDGPTLAVVLLEGALGHQASIALGYQLAAGLAHAHAQDITHRDVKPSNVLLDTDAQRPLLADFGLARLTDSTRITRTGVCVGTAAYLAPEQLEGQSSPASDVYALGLVLIECLTGTLCYPGPVAEAALARLHRSPVVPAGLPGWLQHTLRAMTDREAPERPPAEAVAAALQAHSVDPLVEATRTGRASIALVAGSRRPGVEEPVTEVTAMATATLSRRPRRRRIRTGVAAATVAVVVGCAALGLVAGHELRVDAPGAEQAPSRADMLDPRARPPASTTTTAVAASPSTSASSAPVAVAVSRGSAPIAKPAGSDRGKHPQAPKVPKAPKPREHGGA